MAREAPARPGHPARLAERPDGDLDVVLTRKIPAPRNEEFAVGAVDETGRTYIAPYASSSGATPEYIEREVAIQLETMRRRRAQYTPARAPLDPSGRVAIVVDVLASVQPWTPRGLEVRGTAELHDSGGLERFGRGWDEAWLRIVPERVISWGIEAPPFTEGSRSARSVSRS